MTAVPEITRAQLDSALGLTLTAEQWRAVSAPLRSAVIVAGAGSGKTTSMAARVAWLAGSGIVRPDAVLGLTFTSKAAAGLLRSMRSSLQALDSAGLLAAARAAAHAADVESGLVADHDAHLDAHLDELGEPQVLTYHSFAARIVSENAIRLGREPGATVMSPGLRSQMAYRLVCRTTLPLSTLGKSPVSLASDLLALDDELTELALTPADVRDFDAAMIDYVSGWPKPQVIAQEMRDTSRTRALLAELLVEWHADKAAHDLIDFADQIRLALQLVEGFPEVAAEVRSRFAAVLLDEYQDTSIAQRRTLQAIFGPQGTAVMAVGDPCQAIYGWRGASVDNIEHFPEHFAHAGVPADRHQLTENRRSGPAILDVANRVSAHLREVHSGVGKLTPGPNDKGPGHVSCALFETYQDEITWLAGQVDATHAGGAAWRDIAVLAATSRDLVEVDRALRLRGIPTQLVGAAALLAQPAVIDLRSWLEVIHDPTANPAFLRIASGPRWRIGPRDLAALGARAAHLAGGRGRQEHEDLARALDDAVAGTDMSENISLSEALDEPGSPERYSPEAWRRFAGISAAIHDLRRHAGEPLADLIGRVLHVTGIAVEAAQSMPDVARQQEQAIAAFIELAAEFIDPDGRMGLGAFLAALRDAERLDVDIELDVAGASDAVQLLTIHKSKGMEFPYVFVPFVADGSFPTGRGRPAWTTSAKAVPWPLRADCTDDLASFPDRDAEPRRKDHDAYRQVLRTVDDLEEQRLAYVAFTRAERGLAVSGHWWGPTQSTPRGPDRFLRAVHEFCLDGHGTVALWADAPADDAVNPQASPARARAPWPLTPDPDYVERLRAVADSMAEVAAVQSALPGMPGAPSQSDERVAEWDIVMAGLIDEARARRSRVRVVRLPDSVSATTVIRALEDPAQVAADLVRPMPAAPAPAARRGTRLHAWIETRYGQQPLLDPDDLPGAADADIGSDADLARLQEAFEASPYAERRPVAIEESFSLLVAGRVVVGRIDAVFADDDDEASGRFEVVDWKTGSARGLHPMQLAIYRLAWARARGIDVAQVSGAFVMVATGEVIRPDTDREVELLLSGLAGRA